MTVMNTIHPLDAESWAQLHFANTPLGDNRRTQRAITIARQLAQHPGHSIPKLFNNPYDVKAAYTFFDREEVTPQNLQAPHRQLVFQKLRQNGTYLLIEDSSEFSWQRDQEVAGLGPVGDYKSTTARGFKLHTTLAVQWFTPAASDARRPPVEVLGVASQEFYQRKHAPAEEKITDEAARRKRDRESLLWPRATERLGSAPKHTNVRWVHVADRGADIETFLRGCVEAGQGFVVRACYNRKLLEPQAKKRVRVGHLFDTARVASALGEFEFRLRGRAGVKARTVRLSVSATRVHLWPTPHPDGRGKPRQAGLEVSVVRAWEADPPPGVQEPLEWILLTDANVASFEEAHEVVLQYQARWLAEEFHKALKTGLGAEKLQLETGDRLFAAISVMSVVATRLLSLKEQGRIDEDAPACESGLDDVEREVLGELVSRDLLTVGDVMLAVGRLGGHMNRKADGWPGWQTLWAGWQQLSRVVQGYRLAQANWWRDQLPASPG